MMTVTDVFSPCHSSSQRLLASVSTAAAAAAASVSCATMSMTSCGEKTFHTPLLASTRQRSSEPSVSCFTQGVETTPHSLASASPRDRESGRPGFFESPFHTRCPPSSPSWRSSVARTWPPAATIRDFSAGMPGRCCSVTTLASRAPASVAMTAPRTAVVSPTLLTSRLFFDLSYTTNVAEQPASAISPPLLAIFASRAANTAVIPSSFLSSDRSLPRISTVQSLTSSATALPWWPWPSKRA
mmetsp:Transcript_17883/g.42540  ORF Transcript_17883/g.42540 Transcript_17883/m.42540 type:complete len:242 (+) Transcript_17883:114-839(+)